MLQEDSFEILSIKSLNLSCWWSFLSWVNLFLPPFSPCYDFVSQVTNASGSIGYGAFFHPHWFNGKWLPHQRLGSSPDVSIALQELFLIYLACAVWGSSWHNRHIHFSCDNQAVVSIIITKSSKIPCIMDLLRLITLLNLQHNFTLTAVHLAGLQNGVTDSLSHFQMDRFRELAPEAYWLPHPGISDSFLTSKVSTDLWHSLAPSTRRTYTSGEKQFILLCLKHGLVTPATSLLPAKEVLKTSE